MVIDKSSFFILVGTLAAGGGGGYLAAKQGAAVPPQPPPSAAAPETASAASSGSPSIPAAMSASAAALPPCDDAAGAPGACPPPVYSADETGCGPLPSKRCADFKEAMKPKVAERAVACLNSLKPSERCDLNRINLCGHIALMSACAEPAPEQSPAHDDVGASCQAIVDACGGSAATPTLRDCRATLAGMTDTGRAHAVECMKKHCSDKGLVGCEAMVETK